METPLSTRRVTRSQTTALASQKSKQEDTISRSRTVLLDITNDSPIVGLATGALGDKTPSSSLAKNRIWAKQTPGSGEALLRGQVKTLLQKVEEEAEIVKRASSEDRIPLRALMGIPVSPAQLLAPTPANTPQILNLSDVKEDRKVSIAPPVVPCQLGSVIPHQMAEALREEEGCLINRALLFDSPGNKSEVSDDSSTPTCQGNEAGYLVKSHEDDESSAWSPHVNGSIQEEEEDDDDDDNEEQEEEYEEEDNEALDDLCEGLMKMSVQDENKLPEFTGKHTRFIYNSDDEIEREEEVGEKKLVSPGVVLLKGLPVPEEKHLRFQDEEEI